MSLVVRKPVFGVSDQVRHKPGCTATEDSLRLEISDLGSTISVAKAKALISCAVTGQLMMICVFVFAYAESRFSHNEAHMYMVFIPYPSCIFLIVLSGKEILLGRV